MFITSLLNELRAAGVSTSGVTTAAGKVPAGAVLITTRWHTLDDVLQQMMKESDNLYAESVYYQVAASTGERPAKARHAQKVEVELLNRAGLQGDAYRLADGSGLSLYNYLSVEAEVQLLRYAWQHRIVYDHLLPSLPIAGIDGTLKKRMTDDEAACGNVMAKTGTVTGISSLAGYCTAPDGHRLAFAVINQGIRHSSDGRLFQDRLCHILCTAQ
jgi:D-alanyl-D-alanine carboxypeptidase/D-alanyl-D-alanine-endopeptidase (penicillin-binding protein 4)